MSKMINVNIRMDMNLKKQVEELFEEFGINMTTAMVMFAKAVVREKKIPFDITVPRADFENPYHEKIINERIERINNGTATYVAKTIEELEAMGRE